MLAAPPASAENPSQIVEETAGDGIYVSNARQGDFDESMFTEVVAAARADGIELIVVVPFEALPSTTAFALRSRQATDADVAIVFGPDDVFAADVAEDFEDTAPRAVNAARNAVGPVEQVEAFLLDLTTEPERVRPAIIDRLVRWTLLLLLLFLGAAFMDYMWRQARRSRRRVKLMRSQNFS